MSLFQHFQRSGKLVSKPSKLCESIKNKLPENINGKELDSIQESLTLAADTKNKKRVCYMLQPNESIYCVIHRRA